MRGERQTRRRTSRLCSSCGAALGRRVRVDELHLDGAPVAAHEQELIAFRKAMLDERRRQRREQVLVDRALERPRAHRGREPLVEQEVERRGLPLDGPFAVPQAAPLEHARQLLGEDAAHQLARQRAEDDDRVEPVDELGAEVWWTGRMT